MVSVRKRKMARSSVKKSTRRLKDKHRDVNIAANPIIAAKWDKSLTLLQNYKKLGLRSRLGQLTGGHEKDVLTLSEIKAAREANQNKITPQDIEQTEDPAEIPEGEARIIRDKETNEVIRVIHGTKKMPKPEEMTEENEVIKQLRLEAEKNSKIKKEATPSERECEWAERLYNKHGDDYEAMKWDKKLNPMQQSVKDLRNRILRWKKFTGKE